MKKKYLPGIIIGSVALVSVNSQSIGGSIDDKCEIYGTLTSEGISRSMTPYKGDIIDAYNSTIFVEKQYDSNGNDVSGHYKAMTPRKNLIKTASKRYNLPLSIATIAVSLRQNMMKKGDGEIVSCDDFEYALKVGYLKKIE